MKKVIGEILNLINEPNKIFDGNIYSFKYSDNITNIESLNDYKYNKSIVLTGYEKISKYEELYKKLYDSLKISKKISFKSFKEITQNLVFDNRFNEKNIKEKILDLEEFDITEIRKIYGLTMTSNYCNYGKYTFIRYDYICEYINLNFSIKKDDFNTQVINSLNQTSSNEHFVYILVNNKSVDKLYSRLHMNEELEKIVNFIRYLSFIRDDRYYIDIKPFFNYVKNSYEICYKTTMLCGATFEQRDRSIKIDDSFFQDKKYGYDKLWTFFSKETLTNLESRILNTINWVGIALNENNQCLIVTEIAFAFETLLAKEGEFITKSITADLAETYAFINGTCMEERIKLENEFKNFYKCRSKIAHGIMIESNNFDIVYYYNMIQKTITNLLVRNEFKECFTGKSLSDVIKMLKYSC